MTNLMKYGNLVFLVCALVLASCKNDDDGDSVETVPPELLSDIAPEDDAKIKEFLSTHFYNYEDFDPATQPADFDFKIRIDTLAGDNAQKRPLSEDAVPVTLKVSSSFLGLSAGEEDVPHTLYYVEARAGGGGSPTFADSIFVSYKGTLLDGTVFDENKDFIWFEITNISRGARGFSDGVAQMKAGTPGQVIDHGDGTFSFGDSGIGMFILPSGLGYFNRALGSIPTYSPLIFQIELGTYVEDTDTDNDGVPNIREDVNGNGYLFDDDTDGDLQANFLDVDDDGDGVTTRKEITDDNGEIIFPYPDSNGDGIPDYLDPNVN